MSQRARIILPRPTDAPQNPPPEPPPRAAHKKRSVVATACHSCRQRRSKCDGKSPCTPCLSKGTRCQYDGPPGMTRAAAQREKMGRMEVDNTTMSDIIDYLQNKLDEEAQDLLTFIRSQSEGDLTATAEWLRSKRQESAVDTQDNDSSVNPMSGRYSSAPRLHDLAQDSDGEESPKRRFQHGSSVASSSLHARTGDQEYLWRTHATVATVRRAVKTFFESSVLLFHIYKEQRVAQIMEEALGTILNPETTIFLDVFKRNPDMRITLAEIAGLASVSLLYMRVSKNPPSPPKELAQHFYDTARWMLDSAIEKNPLRAMKMCTLLCMYNIGLKETVALVYIELGINLGRTQGLHNSNRPAKYKEEEWKDCQRTWRTLSLFSGWLGVTLAYRPSQIEDYIYIPPIGENSRDEHIVLAEMVKITIMKAKIMRTIRDDLVTEDNVIAGFRSEISGIHSRIPEWMSMKVLTEEKAMFPLRHLVMYLHLFYLSAMQLLHRRVMREIEIHKTITDDGRGASRQAVIEGVIAAKMAAKFLGVMASEGMLIQTCWLCIFSAYTTAVIILQATLQKILCGYAPELWTADLDLVTICIETLESCKVDQMAGQFKDLLWHFMQVIEAAVDGQIEVDPSKANAVLDDGEYLFIICEGDSGVHKLSRDLLRLVRQPFHRELEVVPDGGLLVPNVRQTLISCFEASIGASLEWTMELQIYRDELRDQDAIEEEEDDETMSIEVMSQLSPGRFLDGDDDMLGASSWSPYPRPL